MSSRRLESLTLALALSLLACSTASHSPRKNADPERTSTPAQREEGLALIAQFECARCHAGVGEVSAIKNCTGCHQEILGGDFDADADIVSGWQEHLAASNSALIDTLDLRRVEHFRRDWVIAFLVSPHDVRPSMGPMMPRLNITPDQATAMAFALVPSEEQSRIEGDAARGEALVREGQCGRCHQRGGDALPGHARVVDEATRKAPDLAHAGRWQSAHLLRWLMNPRAMDEDTLMPQTGYSLTDAQDVAAFLISPVPSSRLEPSTERLPLLEREVFHDEVEARVFRRLCWHCHGDPDYARSEGGPGNTGGFGFAPRRLDLSSYEGIMSGAVRYEDRDDEVGSRYSVLFNEGTPRLVEALLARHREVSEPSSEPGDVRGMPLGMPPLSFEDIQLVESWVAQGARR